MSADIHTYLANQFQDWIKLGSGKLPAYPDSVSPEPPFRPFTGYRVPRFSKDDGRRGLFGLFTKTVALPETEPEADGDEEPDFDFETIDRNDIVEMRVTLPPESSVRSATFAAFLRQLDNCQEPVTLEVCGTSGEVTFGFALGECDVRLFTKLLTAVAPEVVLEIGSEVLERKWESCHDGERAIVECSLAREFYYPIISPGEDYLVSLVGVLSDLQPGELGLLQVIFKPTIHPWAASIARTLLGDDGEPVFPEYDALLRAAASKATSRLFGVVVRIAACAPDASGIGDILSHISSCLGLFWDMKGNGFVPIPNDDYEAGNHLDDLLLRQSRRFGMLLTEEELTGLVHLPSSQVASPRFSRHTKKTKAAPSEALQGRGLFLGENDHRGRTARVFLNSEHRVRHMHVVGAPGTGKSTLLSHLIRDDIARGEGVAVLDPHGDLVNEILGTMPADRIDDVVLLDPGDDQAAVGFNILTAHSEAERIILASDLVSIFQRLSTTWGDQMGVVLRNSILVFLESSRGGTLADLRRFLIDDRFRSNFLETVSDHDLLYYWKSVFPLHASKSSVSAVVTRLETFLAPKPVRFIVSQTRNTLDFSNIMDSGKVFLARLTQGVIGRENAALLGSLLVSKLQQTAMVRQRVEIAARRDFWLYIDEFQNFITPSMAEIIAEARKLRLGLILAHQELGQLHRDQDVAHAVTTIGTRIVFRVSDSDAKNLDQGFQDFTARDIQALEIGHAICRLQRSDYDFNLRVPAPQLPGPEAQAQRRREAIERSRKKYSIPRTEIEGSASKSSSGGSPPEVAQDNDTSNEFAPSATPPPEQKRAVEVGEIELGKGDAEHRELQAEVKRLAEEAGFRAQTEHPLRGSQSGVDVALFIENQPIIAVEVCVTSSADQELAKIVKCLDAGYRRVLTVVSGIRKRKLLRKMVETTLGDRSSAVACVAISEVGRLLADPTFVGSKPSGIEVVGGDSAHRIGWRVRRTIPADNPDNAKRREAAALEILARAMRGEK